MSLTALETIDIAPTDSLSESRFILAKLGDITLVFPTNMVTEILVVERAQLLPLPFYDQVILGCIHHAGKVVPLMATDHLLHTDRSGLQEQFTVIYLSQAAEQLSGVGLTVDRVLGSKPASQLPPGLVEQKKAQVTIDNNNKFWFFLPQFIEHDVWQPKHWKSM